MKLKKMITILALQAILAISLCTCGTEKNNQNMESEKEIVTEKEATDNENNLFDGFITDSVKALINEGTKIDGTGSSITES